MPVCYLFLIWTRIPGYREMRKSGKTPLITSKMRKYLILNIWNDHLFQKVCFLHFFFSSIITANMYSFVFLLFVIIQHTFSLSNITLENQVIWYLIICITVKMCHQTKCVTLWSNTISIINGAGKTFMVCSNDNGCYGTPYLWS